MQEKKKNVLFVDDDEVMNFLNTKTLQHMGIAKQIHTALNGKKAIDLRNNYFVGSSAMPDVILLDFNIPIMDGFQFIEFFQKLMIPNSDHVKIVIVTSSRDQRDMARAKSYGIEHFLTKPIGEKHLREVLLD